MRRQQAADRRIQGYLKKVRPHLHLRRNGQRDDRELPARQITAAAPRERASAVRRTR